MKKLLVVVVVGLVFAQGAQAATLSPSPQPFGGWLARSYVAWPYESIAFKTGRDPCDDGASYICGDPGPPPFVGIRGGAERWHFLWAVGVAAEGSLTANQRERVAHLLGHIYWTAHVSDHFDSAYKRCAMKATDAEAICVRMLRTL